jgi:6-phosphogluconate dehydrogenase
MQVGILGLGKMGKALAEKLMSEGHEVVVWNRSKEALDQYRIERSDYIVKQKLKIIHSFEELRDALWKPRVFWSMLPAGEPTNAIMADIANISEAGDIVVDGGNAHFSDTEKHFADFSAKGVKFLGVGTSGGIHGVETGFCFMVGGSQDAYEYLRPAFDSLSKPYGGHSYFGTGGAGHFVKMVHNGIEYGMMQALAEGFGLLSKSSYHFNLLDIGSVWQQGSIVRSYLLECVLGALSKDPGLAQASGYINATGEAKWTVEQGKQEHVPVDVIEKSLDFRNRSQYDKVVQETFAAKLVSAMRQEFGGHAMHTPEEKPQG